MASVILCSELGRGPEHLANLADYAVALGAQGYSLKLVTHDMSSAHNMSEFSNMAIFQAPKFRQQKAEYGASTAGTINYSSVLRNNGYHHVSSLAPLLRGWLHLHATLNADIVIADHAPTALLAAKLLEVPSIITGSGFCVPPLVQPLSSICPWAESPEEELMLEDESLLKKVNDSISGLGFSDIHLKYVTNMFAGATQWIVSIPEMDHYGARDQTYVAPSLDSTAPPVPKWPRSHGDKILVYLAADSIYLNALLEQLQMQQQPVLAIVPEVSTGLIKRYQGTNVSLQRELVDLRQAANQCRLFINDGQHDIVYQLLTCGAPSIILPSELDQILLAYRLAEQGLGFVGPETPNELNLGKLIGLCRAGDQVWMNYCSHLQAKYENDQPLSRLQDLVKDELLG